jgi:hypothetical protein
MSIWRQLAAAENGGLEASEEASSYHWLCNNGENNGVNIENEISEIISVMAVAYRK